MARRTPSKACPVPEECLPPYGISPFYVMVYVMTLMLYVISWLLCDLGGMYFVCLWQWETFIKRPCLKSRLSADDIYTMQKDFAKMRPVLPPMVVCVPEDRTGCRYDRLYLFVCFVLRLFLLIIPPCWIVRHLA